MRDVVVVVVCLLFWAVALLSPGCDTKETFSLELIVAKQYVMNQWEKRDEAGCPENFHKCDAKRSDNMGSLCAWGVCVHGSVISVVK